jgi:hypothetical protein
MIKLDLNKVLVGDSFKGARDLATPSEEFNYQQWKTRQTAAITERGAGRDEESYISLMVQRNMNAYICHREVDAYAGCLQKHNLIASEDMLIPFKDKNSTHQLKCRWPLMSYQKCMASERNRSVLYESAVMHSHCGETRSKHFHCIAKHRDQELLTNEPQCIPTYRALLRCGLNFMWEEYWKKLSNLSDEDEYSMYDTESDPHRKADVYGRMSPDMRRHLKDSGLHSPE